MICLDTNYLILGLVRGSRESRRLIDWSEGGEKFFAPSTVWYEFLCGPVGTGEIAAMRAVVKDVVPFDESQAEESARLFNATGRRRQLRVDAMIAAAATSRGAPLATNNTSDFEVFRPHGLRLIGSEATNKGV